MSFTYVTVTADYDLADGTDPSGTVTFTPTAPMINGGVVNVAAPVVHRVDVDGVLSISLAANTDSATAPSGTAYKVTEQLGGTTSVTRTYYVSIPHDAGSTVDLSSLATVGTAPAISFPPQTLNVLLSRMASSPVTVSYATTVTPDASLGCVFRITATGDLTLADPVSGTDGQQVVVEILASGADRTLTVGAGSVLIPSGTWWVGQLIYHSSGTFWVLR